MMLKDAEDCIACKLGLHATTLPTGRCNHEHTQVIVLDPQRKMVNIDVGVLRGVLALWGAEIETLNSCEGVSSKLEWLCNPGSSRPYIQVWTKDAKQAAKVLAHIGIDWVAEPTVDPDRLTCLVPQWAADYAADRIAKYG